MGDRSEGAWRLPRVAEVGIVVVGLGGTGATGYAVIEHRVSAVEDTLKELVVQSTAEAQTLNRLELHMTLASEHRQLEGHASAIRALDNHDIRLKALDNDVKRNTSRIYRMEREMPRANSMAELPPHE